MWQLQDELDRLHITVIPISFQKPAPHYFDSASSTPPVDYFLDLDRHLYHHFGMFSAGFWDLWGPRTWIAYFRLLLKGEKLQKSAGDIEQRGGDIVIDPTGLIRLHHISTGPGDRPSIASVLKMIETNNFTSPVSKQ